MYKGTTTESSSVEAIVRLSLIPDSEIDVGLDHLHSTCEQIGANVGTRRDRYTVFFIVASHTRTHTFTLIEKKKYRMTTSIGFLLVGLFVSYIF